ncbi:hypothetical protein D3C74_425030 [compost metagenome]
MMLLSSVQDWVAYPVQQDSLRSVTEQLFLRAILCLAVSQLNLQERDTLLMSPCMVSADSRKEALVRC